MIRIHSPALLISTAFLLCASVAHAGDDAALIEGTKLCTSYLPRHERQYGIPVHLLAAISSTESGRYHKGLGMSLPWPWTINVEGKGYFFDTKAEAVTAVKQLQERGFKSIDVGCMQVNLHHHPEAFSNLEQAFDPAYNIAYGAQFLKKNFEESGSWKTATAYYHSKTPSLGDGYSQLVFNAWSRIINKVADARAGKPLLVANKTQTTTLAQNTTLSAPPAQSNILKSTNARSIQNLRPTYHSTSLNSISVTSESTKEQGVLVIRTNNVKPSTDTIVVAQNDKFAENKGVPNTSITNNVTSNRGQFSPRTKIIRVNQSQDLVTKKNATFVFDN